MCVCLITFQKVVSKCSICLAYFDECTYYPSNCVSQAPLQPPNCAVLVFISQFTNTHTHDTLKHPALRTHIHTRRAALLLRNIQQNKFSSFLFSYAALLSPPCLCRHFAYWACVVQSILLRFSVLNLETVSALPEIAKLFSFTVFLLAIFAAPPPLSERVCVCVCVRLLCAVLLLLLSLCCLASLWHTHTHTQPPAHLHNGASIHSCLLFDLRTLDSLSLVKNLSFPCSRRHTLTHSLTLTHTHRGIHPFVPKYERALA